MSEEAPQAAGNGSRSDRSALERDLAARAKNQAVELTRVGFARQDYASLGASAKGLVERAVKVGLEGEAADHLREYAELFRDVQRLLDDPKASVVAPSNAEIYRAALAIETWTEILGFLDQTSAAWRDRAREMIAEDLGSAVPALRFAALCRSIKIQFKPARRADGQIVGEMDLRGWRVGVVVERVDDIDALAAASARASSRLAKAGLPGIVVLEVSRALPPAPRLRRVADDRTAAVEMNAHTDAFLVQHHGVIADAGNPEHAFAAVAMATLRTTNVSSGRVGFAGVVRAVNLCEPEDPRMARLGVFMEALSRAR